MPLALLVMMHPFHYAPRARAVCFGAKEQKEVRADLDGSAGRFRSVHRARRRNTTATVRGRPILRIHDQHRPHFPPDRRGVDTAIVDDVIVIRSRHEYRVRWWVRYIRHARKQNR